MKATRTVKWESSGKAIKVVITITRETIKNSVYADGWNVDIGNKAYQTDKISVFVNNNKIEDTDLDLYIDSKGNRHLTNKIMVTDMAAYNKALAVIADAKAEAEQDEEWKAAKAAENTKEAKSKAIKSGLCPKCGTYCYGDCAASR